MSNRDKVFALGSSPAKELDRLFEEQNLPDSGTGWTPYIDKIFGTGGTQYRASPRPKSQRQREPSTSGTGGLGSIPGLGMSPGQAARVLSSPNVDPALWAAMQGQAASQTLDSLGSSLKTPIADKSFKVSDYFFETPSFLRNDELFANAADKENDPLMMGVFSTPSSKKFIQQQQQQLQLQQQMQQQQTQQHQVHTFKTPLKSNGNIPESSPSTILLTSTVKKESRVNKTITGIENSPTPATKSHLKKAPCQLVRANSAMEPALGIFHDGETHRPGRTNSRLPLMATFSSQQTGNRHRSQPEQGKFQIIFADMNTLRTSSGGKRAKKGPRKKKSLARFKTAPAVVQKRDN